MRSWACLRRERQSQRTWAHCLWRRTAQIDAENSLRRRYYWFFCNVTRQYMKAFLSCIYYIRSCLFLLFDYLDTFAWALQKFCFAFTYYRFCLQNLYVLLNVFRKIFSTPRLSETSQIDIFLIYQMNCSKERAHSRNLWQQLGLWLLYFYLIHYSPDQKAGVPVF